MDAREAEVYLKAFDNEIIRLADKLSHTQSYKALKKISEIDSAPVPILKHEAANSGLPDEFLFNNLRGIYTHDTINNKFIKQSQSDSIIIYYKYNDKQDIDVSLIIADYREEITSSSFMFPTIIEAKMLINGNKRMEISHSGSVEYGMPVDMDFAAYFDEYKIGSIIKTKLSQKSAVVRKNTFIEKNSEPIFSWNLQSILSFDESVSFYIKTLSMQCKMYPIYISARVNNDNISPNTNNYPEEFNKNSKITVYSSTDNRKIGEVRLKTKEGSDKLDYALYYNDGSFVYIDELLLSADRILNIKI